MTFSRRSRNRRAIGNHVADSDVRTTGTTEMEGNGYLPSDWRSLDLHRLVAERIRNDPDLLVRAAENIEHWGRPGYEEWRAILAEGLEKVIEVMLGEGQDSARLRSSSPFVTLLSEDERAEVFTRWRDRVFPQLPEK